MLSFVFIKYLDNISYNKIFNYLNENFKFKPYIMHSDYEKALHLGIKENKYTQNALNIKCFFHYTQMIRKKLSSCGICKLKSNKISLEIIRNIQMLCFIDKNNIKKFKDIILDKLSNIESLNLFVKYLKHYLLYKYIF